MLAFAQRYPSAMSQARMQVYAASRHYEAGSWDDALAELETLDLRPEHGYLDRPGVRIAALVTGHRDDRAASVAQLAALAGMPLGDETLRNQVPR